MKEWSQHHGIVISVGQRLAFVQVNIQDATGMETCRILDAPVESSVRRKTLRTSVSEATDHRQLLRDCFLPHLSSGGDLRSWKFLTEGAVARPL